MPRQTVSWTDAPFNWPAQPDLDEKELNSPQPCGHGAACTYNGPCAFVHPGEEGTGRRLFPGRTIEDKDGNQVEQAAAVRLIGSPSFYERRRLKMSWPQWCAKKGIKVASPSVGGASAGAKPGASWPSLPQAQMPQAQAQPQAQPQAQMTQAQMAQAQMAQAQMAQAQMARAQMAQMAHAQMPQAQLAQAQRHCQQLYEMQQMMAVQEMKHMEEVLHMSQALDRLRCSNEAFNDYERKCKADSVELRNLFGKKLYEKLTPFIADVKEQYTGTWPESATAGKIAGMFLELENSTILEILLDEVTLSRKFTEAMDILAEASSA